MFCLSGFVGSAPAGSSDAKPKDASKWVKRPPDMKTYEKSEPISFAKVQPAMLQTVVKWLEPCDIVSISHETAKKLTGQSYDSAKSPLYVVRGVAFEKTSGKSTVTSDGRNLFVSYLALGKEDRRLTHQPVVVAAEKRPVSIYVWATMAE